MDSFEINKIIAAVLVTVLIVLGIGKISDLMFNVDKPTVAAFKDFSIFARQRPAASGGNKIDTKLVKEYV